MNGDARGVYSHNKQIRFETSMLRSSLCDYSDAYILANNNVNKVIFKNCAPIY